MGDVDMAERLEQLINSNEGLRAELIDPTGPQAMAAAALYGEVGMTYQDMVEAGKWEQDSLCAQTDPDMFFPEKGGSTKEAKRVCNDCEVRQQCLARAVLNKDLGAGILGGLSVRERRKLFRMTDAGDDLVFEEDAEAA